LNIIISLVKYIRFYKINNYNLMNNILSNINKLLSIGLGIGLSFAGIYVFYKTRKKNKMNN